MLHELQKIMVQVSESATIRESLNNLVTLVKQALKTEACTVCLLDRKHNEHVLVATDGLEYTGEQFIRFDASEGLVGLVSKRAEPINVENALLHSNYFKDPRLNEEQFHAFLGVPIIFQKKCYGVLVIQQREQRLFDKGEEAFLFTIATQLASIIAKYDSDGKLESLWESKSPVTERSSSSVSFSSQSALAGVSVGVAVVVYPAADLDNISEKTIECSKKEIKRFRTALQKTTNELENLRDSVKDILPSNEQAVFDIYLNIATDPIFQKKIETQISDNAFWSEYALYLVISESIRKLQNTEDSYLRERSGDFFELGQRLLANLQSQKQKRTDYPQNTILVGDEITAAVLAEVPRKKLVGVISKQGTKNSHAAIVARAMGLPMIMGVSGINITKFDGQTLILDGYCRKVYASPSKRLLKQYKTLAREEREFDANLQDLRDQPALTIDDHQVRLMVNTNIGEDLTLALSMGNEGVGLFRTEISFLNRDNFPTEEEQFARYRQLLQAFSPRPVVMRTLDIGGDKALPYFPIKEENPFLGWRGLRVTLDHPEIFLVQIRAMLRANAGLNNLKIMLPMVTHVGEVAEAKKLINRAAKELTEENIECELPPIGVMIEVPSAAYQTKQIAKHADFISIGSNDLTQYLLAVDRNNPRVESLYDPLNPAVISAIKHIHDHADAAGKPVSLCGEMAGDPTCLIVLLGMGFTSLSINPTNLPRIKWIILNFTQETAETLLEKVMLMDNPLEIRTTLEHALERAGLGAIIRAGV